MLANAIKTICELAKTNIELRGCGCCDSPTIEIDGIRFSCIQFTAEGVTCESIWSYQDVTICKTEQRTIGADTYDRNVEFTICDRQGNIDPWLQKELECNQ